MQTGRQFWRMSGSARGRVFEAAIGLTVTRAGLYLLGFRRWKVAIEWFTRSAARSPEETAPAQMEFARALELYQASAARHLPLSTTCLDRAMTLWWLLRKRGISAELHIGALKENGNFEAHAWVEAGGAILGGASDGSDFTKFERPAAAMGMRTP